MLPSRKRTQGGASLCPGLSHFAPLGRTDRWFIVRYPKPNSPKQARGEIYCGDLQAPAPKKRLGCCRFTIWGSFRPCQRDVGRVELHKTAFLRHKPFCVSQMQRKSSSPLRKTTRFSHYGKNASFLKSSQYPQRTGARD